MVELMMPFFSVHSTQVDSTLRNVSNQTREPFRDFQLEVGDDTVRINPLVDHG